jgi:AAA domain
MDWHTCALEFAREAGWTRQRAEEWVVEHLRIRSPGRTALLTVPYRLDPPLAHFLSDLLFAAHYQPVQAASKALVSRPPVEFVAVPPFASAEGRHRAGGGRGRGAVSVRVPRLRSVKGGAGLEVNLADERPLTQLPSELRALLPRQGLVNYLEALALVKHLETLLGDESIRLACEQWQRRRPEPCEHGCLSPSACDCPPPDNRPAVAVMALYAAQVELLRHLIQQAPALNRSAVAIEIGPPSAFSHRECLFALVSLTRSHTHRAVSYGEHPHALIQALTRASCGLILFGDPGTLARRSQWHGPLDHLDDSAAQFEGNLIGQLVHYLQGHGLHSAVFHVQEGSSK